MLYILAFTHVLLSFECCMRFDVVLALLVSTYRAMRRPIDRGTSDRMALRFFLCINCNNNL